MGVQVPPSTRFSGSNPTLSPEDPGDVHPDRGRRSDGVEPPGTRYTLCDPVAIAHGAHPPTLAGVPRQVPPPQTRHGSLRAAGKAGGQLRPLPVRGVDPAPLVLPGGGPLAGLHRPTAHVAPDGISVIRKLDSGRLSADELVAAAGWTPLMLLEADIHRPNRLRLRPAAIQPDNIEGSTRAHTDISNRILVADGLRTWLGIGKYDGVVAWNAGGDVIEIAPSGFVLYAFAELDRLTDDRAARLLLAPLPDTDERATS